MKKNLETSSMKSVTTTELLTGLCDLMRTLLLTTWACGTISEIHSDRWYFVIIAVGFVVCAVWLPGFIAVIIYEGAREYRYRKSEISPYSESIFADGIKQAWLRLQCISFCSLQGVCVIIALLLSMIIVLFDFITLFWADAWIFATAAGGIFSIYCSLVFAVRLLVQIYAFCARFIRALVKIASTH